VALQFRTIDQNLSENKKLFNKWDALVKTNWYNRYFNNSNYSGDSEDVAFSKYLPKFMEEVAIIIDECINE